MANEVLENESMLGVLIILFLVVVSTIYVITQQQQQQPLVGAGAANANARRSGASAANGPQLQAKNAVVTAGLSEEQLRLHRSLPSRNGARVVTVCVDALVRHKADAGAIAWASAETPRVLADLLAVADVYLLCRVDASDKAVTERIQRFVASVADTADGSGKKRTLRPHKILFCTTSIGKIAFVRQLEPQVHVEVELSIVKDLEKHVPRIVHVVTKLEGPPGVGMHHVTDSFATYFDLLRAM